MGIGGIPEGKRRVVLKELQSPVENKILKNLEVWNHGLLQIPAI